MESAQSLNGHNSSLKDLHLSKDEKIEMIPEADWFFRNIYAELEQLRQSGMSRKEFIDLCRSKNQKTQATRTVYFLEGALETLKYVNQVRTFTELPDFKQFIFSVEQALH